jgi:predicted DNA-binding transcriptional regulator AlpA
MNKIRKDKLLTEDQIAARLQVSLAGLRRWRLLRTGPPFFKLGRFVRYSHRQLQAWLTSRTVQTNQDEVKFHKERGEL